MWLPGRTLVRRAIAALAGERRARPRPAPGPPAVAAPAAGGPPPLSGLDLEGYVAELAIKPRRWVRRRVEQVTFVDAHIVRRRMSIDFALPPSELVEDGQLVWIPVLTAAEPQLRAFDLQDADAVSIPLMTDVQAAEVVSSGLSHQLIASLPEWIPTRRVLAADRAIRRIVTNRAGDPDDPVAVADEELREEPYGALRELIDVTRFGPDRSFNASARQNLAQLLRELARGRLLLAQVPYKADTRQVVKLAYNAQLKTGRAGGGWIDKLRFQANQFASAFGAAGRLEVFDRLIVGQAESYHAEVVVPPTRSPPRSCGRRASGAGRTIRRRSRATTRTATARTSARTPTGPRTTAGSRSCCTRTARRWSRRCCCPGW